MTTRADEQKCGTCWKDESLHCPGPHSAALSEQVCGLNGFIHDHPFVAPIESQSDPVRDALFDALADMGSDPDLTDAIQYEEDMRDNDVEQSPDVSYGRPRVKGRGTPVQELANLWTAGDSIAAIAHDHGLEEGQVEKALRFVMLHPDCDDPDRGLREERTPSTHDAEEPIPEGKDEPTAPPREDQLRRVWIENACGDEACEVPRLLAAIFAIRGGETDHKKYANRIMAPAAESSPVPSDDDGCEGTSVAGKARS